MRLLPDHVTRGSASSSDLDRGSFLAAVDRSLRSLALVLAVSYLASSAVHGGPQDRDDRCHSEEPYFWYRPDQRRDTSRDRPEVHPRLPHSRAIGAGRRHGGRRLADESDRRRALAQELSPPGDPIGYRGLCIHHQEGPLCSGDHRPLPRWVPLEGRFLPSYGSWRGAGSPDHDTLRE